MQIKVIGATPEDFVKRAFKLLYDACAPAFGMGKFQAARLQTLGTHGELVERQPTEEEVWRCVYDAEDYKAVAVSSNRHGRVYGDYVFGRMMKWGCEWDELGDVELPDLSFRPGYNGFCGVYPTQRDLVVAVVSSLGCTYEEVG